MKLLNRLLMPHWPSIYGFALGLIAANLVGRILAANLDDGTEATADAGTLIGMVTYLGMAGVAVAAGIWWGVRRRRQEIVPELLPVFVVVTLFSVLLNPLLSGVGFPASETIVDTIFSQTVFYFVSLALGAFIGYLVVMALGVDHYGRELQATKLAFEKKANPAAATR